MGRPLKEHRCAPQTLAQPRRVPSVTLAGSHFSNAWKTWGAAVPDPNSHVVLGAHVQQMSISFSVSWSLLASSLQGG